MIYYLLSSLMFLLITVFVPVLASRNIFRCVASFRFLVVDLSDLAAQVTGFHAIQANVEPLAVGWMGELGVSNSLTSFIGLLFLRAGESVLELLISPWIASLAAGIVRPHTGSAVFIEVQSSSTRDFVSLALDTVVEHVADSWVWMGKESVLPWA